MIATLVLMLATAAGEDPLDAAKAAGKFPQTSSVIVASGGRTIYERYFEGATAGWMRSSW